MKKLLSIIILFLFSITVAAQEIKYKEYSYTEFFQLIENENDSVFKLKDAVVKYNPVTDKRFRTINDTYEAKDTTYAYRNDIVIDKSIELNNVQFLSKDIRIGTERFYGGAFVDIHFKKNVTMINVASLKMRYCRFDKPFDFTLNDCEVKNYELEILNRIMDIAYSNFSHFRYQTFCENNESKSYTYIVENQFIGTKSDDVFLLGVSAVTAFSFNKNYVANNRGIFFGSLKTNNTRIANNTFKSEYIQHNITNVSSGLRWFGNSYTSPVFLISDPFSPNDIIELKQFTKGFGSYNGLMNFTLKTVNKYPVHIVNRRQEILTKYLDSVSIYNDDAFREEISLKSQFYSHFRNRYNTQVANKVYLNLKDFETNRLQVIHEQNPGFRSYFKWKVNQFLKLFSDYGTEPSKAIVVSMYVILFFAFIYLLFPNTWDKHGKNRIMDRYRFFTKYMNKEAGIHEVYLEEQQGELLASEDFKKYMLAAEKKIPKFFLHTAIPLYNWSISGTKFSAIVLKRVDIMKGTWNEVPKKKRIWKSFLLIGAFLITVCYDLLIKMLNALMLSINTFTTLGFGEIPIKGLPRYLAIIQGFIGWFMLTIFSVSLISQLLN